MKSVADFVSSDVVTVGELIHLESEEREILTEADCCTKPTARTVTTAVARWI